MSATKKKSMKEPRRSIKPGEPDAVALQTVVERRKNMRRSEDGVDLKKLDSHVQELGQALVNQSNATIELQKGLASCLTMIKQVGNDWRDHRVECAVRDVSVTEKFDSITASFAQMKENIAPVVEWGTANIQRENARTEFWQSAAKSAANETLIFSVKLAVGSLVLFLLYHLGGPALVSLIKLIGA